MDRPCGGELTREKKLRRYNVSKEKMGQMIRFVKMQKLFVLKYAVFFDREYT